MKTQNALTRSMVPAPLSARLRAMISLRSDGVRLSPETLTADDREELSKHVAMLGDASHVTADQVAAWCKRLGEYVANPPAEGKDASNAVRRIYEVCRDLPAEVWTHAAVLAWVRQPDRNGFPVGSRWPTPGDLYGFLSKLADPIIQERRAVRDLALMLDAPAWSGQKRAEPERPAPTEAEREAVRAMMAARRAEVAEREAHEAKIRKHGSYTPPGAEGLTGWALLDALKTDLPNLDGDLLTVTQERIEEMQRRFEAAELFMASEAQA